MAKQVVALDITTNSSQAETSVKSLKAQLKEAQLDVQAMADKFGLASEQAREAAKKAADLKDRIGDAKALTEAFNPDAKFKAFTSALGGVTGGFAAVQGAMGLLGAESDNVQKALLKVQSAMAIMQGLDAVKGSIDSFKILGGFLKELTILQKISTAAQWLWNAAMNANPIGALVIGITALIGGIVALVSWYKKSADEAKKQQEAIESSSESLDRQKNALEQSRKQLELNQSHQLAMAKATGQNAEAVRKLEMQLANEKVAMAQSAAATAFNTLEKEKNYLANLKAADADKELVDAQQKNVDKARDILKSANEDIIKSSDERLKLYNRQEEERAAAETENNKKALERQKELNKQRLEADKQLYDQIAKLNEDNFLRSITDENERAQQKLIIDFENERKKIENSKASADVKAKALLANEESFNMQMDELRKKRDDAQFDKDIKDAENAAMYGDAAMNELMARLEAERDAEEKHKNEVLEIDKAKHEARIQLASETSNILGNLANAVGQQTAVGKAFAIAQATMDTYAAANKAMNANYGIFGPAATVAKFASVAATIAMGLQNVKKIAAVQVPAGGGGGSTGGAPSAPSMPQAPVGPQMSQTSLNQQMINQVGNAATRAFVVESDVSGNQERIRRLNRAARIN